MTIGHHFQGQMVTGQLVAGVLNSQHAGTGAVWRINTTILLSWRISANILLTCRGWRHIVSPRAHLVFVCVKLSEFNLLDYFTYFNFLHITLWT